MDAGLEIFELEKQTSQRNHRQHERQTTPQRRPGIIGLQRFVQVNILIGCRISRRGKMRDEFVEFTRFGTNLVKRSNGVTKQSFNPTTRGSMADRHVTRGEIILRCPVRIIGNPELVIGTEGKSTNLA